MTKLITIHNVETGEVVEREMTADELAQWEADKSESQARAQADADEVTAKAALLAKLGITQDEATLLLS